MPELPEVETTRRGIEPWLVGQRMVNWEVRNASLRWPVDIPKQLKNSRVDGVSRRGKYLLIRHHLGTQIIHLGMSGSLRILDQNTPHKTHDHVDILFSNGKCLRYNDPRRFGCVLFQKGDEVEQHPLLKELGVEPLGNEFTADTLFLKSRGRRLAVKNFVMDSKVVVGVGNIYASEALFMAGIRPGTAAGRIPRHAYEVLKNAIVKVLRRSVEQGGTTLRDFVDSDGQPGYFKQQLNVYGRVDEPCRICNSVIKMQVIGQRSSFYCPKCQSSQKFVKPAVLE